MRRQLDLGAYRLLVRFSLLLSVASVVFGMYRLLETDLILGAIGIGLGVALLVPSQYFRIRPVPGAENILVLLSRRNCALCDEARAVLRPMAENTPFTVQEIDVDSDRRLRRRFKNFVPVVLWQGDELARLRIDREALSARLHEILEARAPAPPSP